MLILYYPNPEPNPNPNLVSLHGTQTQNLIHANPNPKSHPKPKPNPPEARTHWGGYAPADPPSGWAGDVPPGKVFLAKICLNPYT